MTRSWIIAGLLLGVVGCNRHDAEALSRIGKKLATRAKESAGDVGTKVDVGWLGRKEPTLQDKIQDRLRWENTLTEVAFEVKVNETEVELKAAVKTPSQRLRAVELAETVVGVTRVIDAIVVQEEDNEKKGDKDSP